MLSLLKNNKKKAAAAVLLLAAILLNVYIILAVDSVLLKILLCLAVNALGAVCVLNMKTLSSMPIEIYRERSMVWALVKNDLRARFAGSYLGIFWAFFQPVITIALYWFVFQVGLRSGNVSDHPFILYLMAGLVPWFYFSEAWMGASGSLIEYNYLVKKVRFNVEILPVLKVASAMFVHVFFLAVLVIVAACYGYFPDFYLLQLPYYVFCSAFLVAGLGYITAACTVFFRDMAQIVNIVLTIGVWITPIMWNPETTMSPAVQKIFRLNPVFYIVDGFRDSLLRKVCFWEKPLWSIYFWCAAVAVYLIGTKIFNRLKVHFSDVL